MVQKAATSPSFCQRLRWRSPLAALTVCSSFSSAVAACSASTGTCRRGAYEQLLLQTKFEKRITSAQGGVQHDEVVAGGDWHNGVPEVLGYPDSGGAGLEAEGLWCQVPRPPPDWNLKTCPYTNVKAESLIRVLTYNLFWWNLFDINGGGDRSAGRLIADTAFPGGYDLMGFQECNDINRVLHDAKEMGLAGEWSSMSGGRGLAVAYRTDRFSVISSGGEDVGEDDASQHYGRRSAHWVRLRHMTGKNVLFVNHHGPLPVSFDGGCAGLSTAENIMRVISQNAHWEDVIVLVGDFNAQAWSTRIRELDRRLTRVYSGVSFGGVDHIFTNCAEGATGRNLGPGHGTANSDHDAISATLRI